MGSNPIAVTYNLRHRACLEQGVPWHSGNYRVWIHSKTRMWHDKNVQPKVIIFSRTFGPNFQQILYHIWTQKSVPSIFFQRSVLTYHKLSHKTTKTVWVLLKNWFQIDDCHTLQKESLTYGQHSNFAPCVQWVLNCWLKLWRRVMCKSL